ncbi:hypothetical protein F5B19DRAFT_200487 [Rostrohypoxylon terebratum]|nr:hypothetical protein F5B19DRAFT_200487 [Rostrohypoxylon terebratum]
MAKSSVRSIYIGNGRKDVSMSSSQRKWHPRRDNWRCPSCGYSNRRWRTVCFQCSSAKATTISRENATRKPGRDPLVMVSIPHRDSCDRNVGTGSRFISFPGDWLCENESCCYFNFSRNAYCRRCGTTRTPTSAYVQESGALSISKPALAAAIFRQFIKWLVKQDTSYGGHSESDSRHEERSPTLTLQLCAITIVTPEPQEEDTSLEIPEPPKKRSRNLPRVPEGNSHSAERRQIPASLFACPFHKAYPHKFPRCRGRTLRDTARVKEHLYRQHLVYQCTRCGDTFDGWPTLNRHQRSDPPCDTVDKRVPLYAINQEQKDILRSRKGLKGVGEHEKWLQIYKMVCPEARPSDPSPYIVMDADQTAIRDFTDFARREMPNLLNRELDVFSSESIIILDHNKGGKDLHRMVDKVLGSLLGKFEGSLPCTMASGVVQDHSEEPGILRDTLGDFHSSLSHNFDFNLDFNFGADNWENLGHDDS